MLLVNVLSHPAHNVRKLTVKYCNIITKLMKGFEIKVEGTYVPAGYELESLCRSNILRSNADKKGYLIFI